MPRFCLGESGTHIYFVLRFDGYQNVFQFDDSTIVFTCKVNDMSRNLMVDVSHNSGFFMDDYKLKILDDRRERMN